MEAFKRDHHFNVSEGKNYPQERPQASQRPHLLFIYRGKSKLLFLSSPQPQNPYQNSSPVAVKHLTHIPFGGYQHHCKISGPVHGLLCITDKEL
ncbi:hypothetical protein F2Q68_00024689 [Brassica cretica]|uniref:Uncharacterized protein n=1 Tax=Brassica cretica TaxID=69181 RepID=A0A8S9ICN6_BRACR|nr:hypothetical protein F2Q68_00024689 [Brassica cretica]